ncbi:facilitated trehalose transporter Tret1-like [Halyomorpha halys]|uniref:facilitated trehalose transporter Tret1-like n=1 Tax=Halyomorpha halys TaxID=286706 RepID=UPI0006D4DA5B|nr:facilitated trehalose transporter Tret1-like [Halyomorpha halys]
MVSGRLRQFIYSIICHLSVIVASAAYSWFEPLTIRLTEDPELNFTSEDISWLVTAVEFGAIVSPFLSGYFTNKIGRKYVIMSIGPLCLAGWILVLCSKSMLSLIMVRILHGLAIGVAFTITPIYAAEIAEPKLRGSITGIYQITYYLGTTYAFSVGPYLSYDMFAYACLPLPIINTIIWIYVPETPYYLLMTKHGNEAKDVLKYFRNGDIEEEFQDMQKAVAEQMSTKGSWKILFCDKVERKALIIVQIVAMAKYLTGMTVFLNYALDSFSKSGSFLSAAEMSILLSVLLAVIAVFAAFMSDWIGRRPLLLVSCFGCFMAHFLTGGYYYIHEKTTLDSSNFTWALYMGFSVYCFFSDIGVGPLLETLQSEMFGANTRGIACGFTQGFVGVLSLIAIKIYTPINEHYGVYLNYWFYSLVALICGLLLSLLMYETAGKKIGQMEDKPWNKVLA